MQFDLIKFIEDWNIRYPFDRFWRKKYNVAFGSPEHRVMNFIDMIIDLREEQIINALIENEKNEAEFGKDFYEAILPEEYGHLQNQVKKPLKQTKKEIDEDFEKIDLTQFND